MQCPVTKALSLALTFWENSPVVVACSGGVDSTVLLHALVTLRDRGEIPHLRAVHVNHGLSENAQTWGLHCQSLCDRWAVPLSVSDVHIDNVSGSGLEQAARLARYQVFTDALRRGECLLQGHHLNDQAETLLFRLFRGTGIDGLSGIPASRPLGKGMLVRPLLTVSRGDIEAYARQHQLGHINDESNENQRFSRNYLRHSLLPEVEQRWPRAAHRLAALADELALVKEQLNDSVTALMQSAVQTRPQWLLGDQPLLDTVMLNRLKPHIRQQVIRCWLKRQQLPVPSRDMLGKVLIEVVGARVDAVPLLSWPGCDVRRYQGFLMASKPVAEQKKVPDIAWNWQCQPELFHPSFGTLRVVASESGGQGIALPENGLDIRVRSQIASSIKIAITGRCGRKTLKRWLQEFRIPPWLRDQIPFLFSGEQMVAAPGLWICDSFLQVNGAGLQVRWEPEAWQQ